MQGLAGLISVAAGAWLAWSFGLSVSALFGWSQSFWLGPALVFLASYLTINAILSSGLSVLQLAGGGIWTTTPVRWLIGKLAFLPLFAAAVWVAALFLPLVGLNRESPLWPYLPSTPFESWVAWCRSAGGWGRLLFDGSALALAAAAMAAITKLIQWEKIAFARVTRPLRHLWRSMKSGVGGSSAFGGLLDEWEMPWKPGRIMVGTSLYEPGQRLGKADDRHFITIATSRSGKGRSAVIPNLLTWPGSALVIDPKGENAAVTARARRQLGQKVHIVDPFRLLARIQKPEAGSLKNTGFEPQRLNPLAEIRLDDLDAVEQIRNLAAALIMPSQQGNPFWDNAARQILDGIIAHVLTWEKLNQSERHLGTVRDYVAQTNGRKMLDLRGNMALGALADKAEALFKQASADAGGDIMTTLNVHMQWLDSPAMRDALAVSDFSFAELKNTESTVYLVIPPEYLDTHARYLRLFITLALRAAGRGRKAKHAMLFILDEFAALGELKVVADAAGQLAGMGVKLWPIIQNLTQLKPYGDNWEVFLANAGQHQVFAMNDQTTARYFSERLGDHIAWRKVRTERGYEWVPHGATLLRTGPELARESSKDNEKALMFFEGGEVSLVRRAAYDAIFRKEAYDPNPYQPPPPFFSRAGIRAAGGFGKWRGAVWNKAYDKIDPPARRDARGERFAAWLETQAWSQWLDARHARHEAKWREKQKRLREEKEGKAGGGEMAARDTVTAPVAPQEPGQGAAPVIADAIEAAPQEPDAPLPKFLKAPPLKKPRKPRAKKPPP